jgi:polyisoprenoid-binding protein YceI
MRILLLAATLLTSVAGDWAIAPGYSVKWSTTGEEAGIFKGLKGTIHFDEANLATASFKVSIDVATINTGNGLMNTHAKSAEWLDASKYPQITFTSTKVNKVGAGYVAIGTLTMHGVTKPQALPFTFQHTATGGLFHATTTVNRLDYGVGKAGDLDEKISIDLTVPVTKQ